MHSSLNIALLAMTLHAAVGACSESEPRLEPEVGDQPTSAAIAVAEQCQAAMLIEVVHRVNGSPITDRLQLMPETAADPSLALRAFKMAADYFGADTVISSRPISQVQCFPQQSAAAPPVAPRDTVLGLCMDPTGVLGCTLTIPSHSYEFSGTESCSVSSSTDAASMSCEDSGVIVTKQGDVVLTINTDQLRADIASKTQALRKLVGDANITTNFHFDIVVTPEQKASIVGNQDFKNIAQQIKQASDTGQPLPDIQQILRNLPQPPTNIEFYTELLQAYQTKAARLDALAKITNGNLLSPQQVNAFYQNYVEKSRLVDRLDVEHSATSLDQATQVINDTINQLANNNPSSTIYNQVRAGGQSMLETHTSNGVYDPDHVIDFVVPDLRESLSDADIEKRLVSADMMVDLNEALRRSDDRGRDLAYAMAGPLGLMTWSIDHNDADMMWRLWDQVKATEFFFDNNNPAGTSYDIHLTPEAQALYNITVQPNSAVAYEVITMLNSTADYNAATGKVTIDYQVIIGINARAALSTDDVTKAMFHTEECYGVMAFLKNALIPFGEGFAKELWGTAKGLFWTDIDFWRDPDAFLEHMKGALINWRQTLDVILQQGIDVINRWPGMTTQEKAELLGRIGAQVWLSIPSEAKQAGRLNEVLQDAVRAHLDQAAKGLQIVERGGVALSEEAAVELAKKMEMLEVSSIDEMVQVADGLDDFLPCSLVNIVPHSAITPRAGRPPCTPAQIAQSIARLEQQAQRLGVRGTQAVLDNIVGAAKAGLHPIGDNLWKSGAGVLYGQDNAFGNRVIHVMNHAVDHLDRDLHGVFDAGPRGTLSVVDEGWQKIRIPNNPDVRSILHQKGVTTFEVNMGRRVGYVGGYGGAAMGNPGVQFLRIAVRDGTSEIITSFPAQRTP